MAASLIHLLHDDTHTSLSGNTRLAQVPMSSQSAYAYFLTKFILSVRRRTLGSVRQMVDENGELMLSQAYQPYGETLNTHGVTKPAFAGCSRRRATLLLFWPLKLLKRAKF